MRNHIIIIGIFLVITGCLAPENTAPDAGSSDAVPCASLDVDASPPDARSTELQRGDVCDPLLDECGAPLTCKDYGPIAICDAAGQIGSEEPCFRTDFCGAHGTCNERPTGDLRCYTVCRIGDGSRCALDEECRAEPWHRIGYGYCRQIIP